ncbi:MAG: DUF1232 domain-containing protein [Actinophytocola sp.]|nr:DUF1232 domain-containing protein [Actinophytocola sp.]
MSGCEHDRLVVGVLLTVVLVVAVVWLLLLGALAIARPRGGTLREAVRLLPDLLRLTWRVAADPATPRRTRILLGLLAVYLAMPIDLVPDFIPVLGYTDDVIVVTLVLRHVARRVGRERLRAHWPGSDEGFSAVCRVTGLAAEPTATA